MHSFISVGLCLALYLTVAQTQYTDNTDDLPVPRARKCRQCIRFFTGEDKRLCKDEFCKTGKKRPGYLRMQKKCNSCSEKFAGKKVETCKHFFCNSEGDGQSSNKCKPCRKFFTGDEKDLCIDMYCMNRHTRPNIKTQKRCNSCPKRFTGKQLRILTCQELFCNPQVQPDPDFVARSGFAITVDILCQYCNTILNQQCQSLYCII